MAAGDRKESGSFLRKLFKISLRTQQAGFPTTGLSKNVPEMENLSSFASPKRAKLRWSSLAFAAPFLIYRRPQGVPTQCYVSPPKSTKKYSMAFPLQVNKEIWHGAVLTLNLLLFMAKYGWRVLPHSCDDGSSLDLDFYPFEYSLTPWKHVFTSV